MSRMQDFELSLPEGRKVTGLVCMPKSTGQETSTKPLIVTLHGGTYAASYYDMDDGHSISNVSRALQVPVICIDRPGYKGSSVQPFECGDTWLQQQAHYLHETILPRIWKDYGGPKTNTTSIVLLGHSTGSAVAIITAAVYSNDRNPEYPLSGIATSGINSTLQGADGSSDNSEPNPDEGISINVDQIKQPSEEELDGDKAVPLWPPGIKDMLLLCSDLNLCSPSAYEHTERLDEVIYLGERQDIRFGWFEFWNKFTVDVAVPHFHTMAEHDRLLKVNDEIMRDFAATFIKCPRMEISILPEAPHSIELSRQGQAWLFRAFGFAMECAVAMDLLKERQAMGRVLSDLAASTERKAEVQSGRHDSVSA